MQTKDLKLNNPSEIPSLTGLRFFAAIFVCIAHLLPRLIANPKMPPNWYLPVISLSAEGMTLFFILSGFVIHYNYSKAIQKNPTLGTYNFLIARLARLWPLYLVCLSIDIFNHYRHFGNLIPNFSEAIIYFLTLTQSWFYHLIANQALIYQFGQMPSVAWSVSTEWFFYLCYPLICFGLIKIPTVRLRITSLLTISLITITSIAIISLNVETINILAIKKFGPMADYFNQTQSSFFRWVLYFSPYSRITEFLVGCLIAAIYMQLLPIVPTKKEELIGLISLVLAILSVVFLHHFIFNPPAGYWFKWVPDLHRCFGFAPSFAIIIFCCGRYQNFITRFFSFPLFLFGGEISYSIYLLHPAVIGFFFRYLDKWFYRADIKFILILAALFGVAFISYKIIEMPARRALRKWLMIRTPIAIETSIANKYV